MLSIIFGPNAQRPPISEWLIIPGSPSVADLSEETLEARFRDTLVCDQTLASGFLLRHRDFRTCVRFVFFDTGIAEWQYSFQGGTAFVIQYKGRNYGVTAKHVVKGYDWHQLIITDRKHGKQFARIRAVFYPTEPKGEAVDGDVVDVVLVDFHDDVSAAFFGDEPYVVDPKTIGTPQPGDWLCVAGALKAESEIDEAAIKPVFCALEFQDQGPDQRDPILRVAHSQFHKRQFQALTGLSGSPVFNTRTKTLAGMAVRAGLNGEQAILRYIDIYDIMKMVEGVHNGETRAQYTKLVAVPAKSAPASG